MKGLKKTFHKKKRNKIGKKNYNGGKEKKIEKKVLETNKKINLVICKADYPSSLLTWVTCSSMLLNLGHPIN